MAIKSTEKLIIESKKPLTKKEIFRLLGTNANLADSVMKEIFEDLTKLIYSELDRCGEFRLFDLGKIKISHTEARMGTNPLTGEKAVFKSKTKLKFSFSKQSKEFAETLYI